ncbi:uncharacterized protein N7459_007760 [Penicillium hispanicum]|uniref:uncharacterized protein n=1 Tax=Penicillium hispanicum TaxID=1080232 RepID=UPI00254244E0|nr:uncharacterized protein N7459_007760 [Penicillium hispanicum]KAJ5578796.1 hypothetical protein N7459_007760 [Penicillium hispanicum]
MVLLGWLFVALGTWVVQADILPKDERCVTAVFSAYNYISFAGEPTTGMWDTRCQNPLKVTSIYAASDIFCRDQERAIGLAQLAALCEEFGHRELLPREAVAENLTEDAVHKTRTVHYLELSRTEAVNAPVLLSASYFDQMFNTIDFWQFEIWSHHIFGYIGYAYWCIILLLGIISRLYGWLFCDRKVQLGQCLESSVSPSAHARSSIPLLDHTLHWVQTHLTVPAPVATGGRALLGCTFSNRAEAIMVAGFWFVSIVLSVVGYRTFPGNILRYSADRTGILAFANLPLLWLFGGRNNILIWATGWSFARFNIFHRHVARVATLQGVAHSLLYFVIYLRGRLQTVPPKGCALQVLTGATFAVHKLWKELSKIYILWGILAFVVMILLLVTSLDRVRNATYEIFLTTHIIFSILTLVGHTIVFEGHDYWKYLWPSVGIWVFDRALRMVRLCYCNLHVSISGSKVVSASSSCMIYDEAADVVRLEVTPGTPFIKPVPGDYYFLYQPFRFTGWENHPFTVGAWSHDVGSSSSLAPPSGRKPDEYSDVSQLPLLSGAISEPESQVVAAETYETEEPKLKLIFWIRPYDGWTQQLRQQCLRAKDRPVETTILLEGPYRHNFPLWKYESVLMIVGGTGIASAVPYLQDHLRRSADGWDESSEEKTRTRDVELVWTAKQPAFLRDLSRRELGPILRRQDVQASFYTTGSSFGASEDLNDVGCDIHVGRPHLQSLIMSRACDASSAGTTLVILVCGPVGMADEARAATHLALRQGHQSIRYVEESFTW